MRSYTRLSLCVFVFAVGMVPTVWGQARSTSEPAVAMVAVFAITGPIIERPVDDTLNFGASRPIALVDLVTRMNKAAADPAVKAVVLTFDRVMFHLQLAQVEELRQAIARIRAGGKEVFVHADALATDTYALFCGASRLSMPPTGTILLGGLHLESPYIRGLLDKIAVVPDFMTCGEYKSAAEIFMRTGPSPQAEEMTNWILDSQYATLVEMIAEGRSVSAEQVRAWIDGMWYHADQARAVGLIDVVENMQDMMAELNRRFGEQIQWEKNYGVPKKPEIDFSSPLAIFDLLRNLMATKKKPSGDSVAVVYVNGPILVGSESSSPFGSRIPQAWSTTIRRALDEAAADETIKAVVLRVDSGGGSVTASEIILDATKRVLAKKPLVVSFGHKAGSGGYYVACGGGEIFADRSTITGSIGVVVGKLATTDMWGKLGVHWHEYQRGAHAALWSSARVFDDAERQMVRKQMDDMYDLFKKHVQTARGDRLSQDIETIAGGRVYTGRQALKLGLIDRIGTLKDAIEYAAIKSNIKQYDVRILPEPVSFFEIIGQQFAGKRTEPPYLEMKSGLGSIENQDKSLLEKVLPMLQSLDPRRSEAILTTFLQLDLLHREGISMIMVDMLMLF